MRSVQYVQRNMLKGKLNPINWHSILNFPGLTSRYSFLHSNSDVLRVMHCCRNEYHLHCFDKWIYTFATDSRPATHPTCPLCKATLK